MRKIEIKICGITNREDASAALAFGADYLGFILYAGSQRAVVASEVAAILGSLDRTVKAVGVFVNETRENVVRVARDCGLHAVQLHGDEKPDGFADMPVPVWRAVRMHEGEWMPSPEAWQVARYVVDADVPGLYGGTGVCADWGSAAELAAVRPVMLGGGLNPENVEEAVRTVCPLGVDVGSGVEACPGKKDPQKIRQFIRAVRGHEQ